MALSASRGHAARGAPLTATAADVAKAMINNYSNHLRPGLRREEIADVWAREVRAVAERELGNTASREGSQRGCKEDLVEDIQDETDGLESSTALRFANYLFDGSCLVLVLLRAMRSTVVAHTTIKRLNDRG